MRKEGEGETTKEGGGQGASQNFFLNDSEKIGRKDPSFTFKKRGAVSPLVGFDYR